MSCARRNTDGNVRVNQDCGYRQQAEELIKWNPRDPNNLIAGMNDLRQGYNLGAFAFSFDGGRTWGDDPPPFYQKLNAPECEQAALPPYCLRDLAPDPNNHTILGTPGNYFTYDGGSDPALAFDLEGRAFFSLIIFDRVAGDGSAVVVTQSPAGAGGSFYNNLRQFTRRFVVAEDNSPAASHDKQFITTDITPGSPNRDNVYTTWTVFRFDPRCGPQPNPSGNPRYCESPIFGSMSTDHGITWSTPEEISGASAGGCFFGNLLDPGRDPHACNFDQGSDPITLPNGDLEVVFNNGNTANGNPNSQQLGVHCRPTGTSPAGTARLNCAGPTFVGSDVTVGEPQCDFGRGPEQCVPGTYVRTNDFPRIAENRGNGHLYATWQDYRNGEYDIQLSESTDGGLTWQQAGTVNPDRGKDHYEPAIDVVCSGPLANNNPNCRGGEQQGGDGQGHQGGNNNLCAANGEDRHDANTKNGDGNNNGNENGNGQGNDRTRDDHVAVSYYRTCRVPGENTTPLFAPPQPGVQAENSDYTLAGGRDRNLPYAFKPVSPIFPPPDGPAQVGFMGDYSGLTVVGQTAHPIWADQRNRVPQFINDQRGTYDPPQSQGTTHDADVFTTGTSIPDGRGDSRDQR